MQLVFHLKSGTTVHCRFLYSMIIGSCVLWAIFNLFLIKKRIFVRDTVNESLGSIDGLLRNDAKLLMKGRKRFSTFRCVGSKDDRVADRALCHFRNVCFSKKNNKFYFYENENEINMPKYFDSGTVYNSFPAIYPHAGQKYSIEIQKGPIPEDARYLNQKLVVYTQAMHADNFGHILADSMFPIFHALNELQLWNPQELRIIWSNYDTIKQQDAQGRSGFEKTCQILTNKTYIQSGFTRYPPYYTPELKEGDVCFENLVLGEAQFAYSKHFDAVRGIGQGQSWIKFRDFLRLKLAGIRPSKSIVKRPQQILVIKREYMRRLMNHDQVVQGLREAFPTVKVVEAALGTLSLAQQIDIISMSTVIITPPGGISFASLFASDDTSLVNFNYWVPSRRKSVGMDQYFFQRIPYLRLFQYPIADVKEIKVELDTRKYRWNDVRGRDRIDRVFKLGGSIHVKLERLYPLVYWAMKKLEDDGFAEEFEMNNALFNALTENGIGLKSENGTSSMSSASASQRQ